MCVYVYTYIYAENIIYMYICNHGLNKYFDKTQWALIIKETGLPQN